MDARLLRALALCGALVSLGSIALAAGNARTPNFVITAPTPELAEEIGHAAEQYRHELAVEWLGAPMPQWAQPCPINAEVSPQLGAGGATSFVFDRGEVFNWQMNIQGSRERILDSVLPHEVTHTIMACHFRRPLPRWADEGMCTTVEHDSERTKQQKLLINFLKTGRGIPFSAMFAMKEYPQDILPIYAQGHSLATFLLSHGGKQKFLKFLAEGMQRERWSEALNRHYQYQNLAQLQDTWLAWVRDGSPAIDASSVNVTQVADARTPANGTLIYRGQSEDPPTARQALPRGTPTARTPAPRDAIEGNWRPHSASEVQPAGVAATPVARTPLAVASAAVPTPARETLIEWSRTPAAVSTDQATGGGPSPYAYDQDGTPSIYAQRSTKVLRR
ncbi:MAG: hypothetical protein JSS27_05995 [Planctomycetes bacterium]|nr:hypothetical protein [Planctomycetota bacterium]